MSERVDTVTISADEYQRLLKTKDRCAKVERANQFAREAMSDVMSELKTLEQCQARVKTAFRAMTQVWLGNGLESK